MKKIYLLSLMLMGSISLFTSCVDGDYYDLYEDEESFIPRNKKGKDNYDYSNYPLMNSDWQEAECVACCLSQFNPDKSKAWCRRRVIEAQFGSFNMKNYEAYFYNVTHAVNMPDGNVQNAVLGGREYYTDSFVDFLIDYYGIGYVPFCGDNLLLYNKSLRHMARVEGVNIAKNSYGGYDLDFYVTDQYDTCCPKYYAYIRNREFLTNIGRFRDCN